MTIKLVLLKSGEEVISDMKEMLSGNPEEGGQVVGYFFKHPCRAILTTPEIKVDDEQASTKQPVSIKLLPWMPLSKDTTIPVVAEWVISIVEPQDKLLEMYQKALKNYEDRQSTDSDSREPSEDTDSGGGSDE